MNIYSNFIKFSCLLLFLLPLASCGNPPETTAQEEESLPPSARIPSVDIQAVSREFLTPTREYIGTTEPLKEVIIRSQAEGQLLELTVDVGDRILKGQTIASLDDTLLNASLARAQAELISLNSAVTEAQSDVISAQAEVESARVRFQQAQVDANRLQQLYEEGAIAKREVELAQTEAKTAEQTLKSAQSQVKVREAAVETAKGRITSQKAVIAEEKKRLAFTKIKSPSDGYVLERLTEEGNLIQTGGEIISIGDFSQAIVNVAVSELDLAKVALGKTVNVKLDAFPNQTFTGIINQISPAAQGDSRQIPLEILLSNPEGKIKQGLLARVKFTADNPSLTIPESALQVGERDNIVFVVNNQSSETKVIAKEVTLGKRRNGKVEVLTGLNEADKIVSRSSNPLEDNQKVKLSAISK
ncbi:efflux RND transporter periplasmic adaptor subunit [Cyanobacterium aponinum AL20118]|uniref:Efflux RND transporter periplasmic adaptor subunit n=1 Tax=Cyanobacterium aponinum AL20115 TaxID=3090662 RepID=A0AAF0Z9H5_9CHRO|nr:efflux RND transporter periplasmic adaptor subunit [Cyanobacterium aponinum]WPF87420.1 efflux RND transporter periplasmic adaptor subunit [Cyanobacterium aponinum AL20115]